MTIRYRMAKTEARGKLRPAKPAFLQGIKAVQPLRIRCRIVERV
ncbi:hypothetical protein [Azospirillum largimobile]